MKTVIIGHFGGYRKMYSLGWTCLIYHATTLFCRRNYNYKNDALGKTVGQMVGAARSARLAARDAAVQAAGAPACPKCGRPMRKMVARKGRNAGNAFWSCTAYPDCTGTRAC